MILMLAVVVAGLGRPQVVEVMPGKPVVVTCARGALTRVVFPEGGPSAGLDLPGPAVLAALGFALEAQDPRVVISVTPQRGFEKAALDFFGPSTAVHLEIQTAPGASGGEIRLEKPEPQDSGVVPPAAPLSPSSPAAGSVRSPAASAPEASAGPRSEGHASAPDPPGAEAASAPATAAKSQEAKAAPLAEAEPALPTHEAATSSEPRGAAEPPQEPPVSEAPAPAPSPAPAPVGAPPVLLTVSRDIGRAVGLRGQRRVILERLYEPADLQRDSKLWLEFRQLGGAKTRVVAITTSWGESATYASRADGSDLLLRVEVPNVPARSKKAWIELNLGGQKYRFKSLTRPTVFNSVKELIK